MTSLVKRLSGLLLMTLLAQSAIGAVVVLGYLMERMRRAARIAVGIDAPPLPNWLIAESFRAEWRARRWWRRAALPAGALFAHVRTGVRAGVALALLFAPAGALMAVSWYAGWNNSFNKGYEFAAVGPAMGLAGLVLLAATLAYAVLAQARAAASGSMRLLFQWRVNAALLGAAPLLALLQGAGYAAAAGCVLAARGTLAFPNSDLLVAAASAPEQFANRWFFAWTLLFVLIVLRLKLLAARRLPRVLGRALALRWVAWAELHAVERALLAPAGVDASAPQAGPASAREPPQLGDSDAGAGVAEARGADPLRGGVSPRRPRLRIALVWLLAALAMLPVGLALYIQQFLNFHGAFGWLNLPMAVLPVIR